MYNNIYIINDVRVLSRLILKYKSLKLLAARIYTFPTFQIIIYYIIWYIYIYGLIQIKVLCNMT